MVNNKDIKSYFKRFEKKRFWGIDGKIWCDPDEENYSHLILMMKDEN